MLLRLMLLAIVVMVAVGAWRWIKSRRLLGEGGLNIVELGELMKLAKRSKRLEAALYLRVAVLGAANGEELATLAPRVDAVLRRLAKQEDLLAKIRAALDAHDERQLAAEIQRSKGAAQEASGPEERARHEERLQSLETQREHVGRLERRERELEVAADHIVVELKNLQLALLDAHSSEATLSGGQVDSLLGQLEEAGEELRQRALAEEEVDRLLRSTKAQAKERA